MSDHVCIGLLAHVDAGKTTLAEQILYLCGSIRKVGRVDHGDSHLDSHELERSRGITVFSSQAEVIWKDLAITLLDTPGHVDFSAEMERTLQVLDYAVLIISGPDGIQGHVRTVWRLLERYEIPVFLFVNKMDQTGAEKKKILSELQNGLSEAILPIDEEQYENIAVCDEAVLDTYLDSGEIKDEQLQELIVERKLFPCFFGAALKAEGVSELLDGIRRYSVIPDYPEDFGARIYKISRDLQGNRLSHCRITGGTLRVKDLLGKEKVDQIRIYSGAAFETREEICAGEICALTGLRESRVGSCYGIDAAEYGWEDALLQPVLNYELLLPPEVNPVEFMGNLRQLEEEDPILNISWQEETKEIHVQVMGEIQLEILRHLIEERFKIRVSFGTGRIVYRETIDMTVEGIGHYEPLRHYAEAHILMEPLSIGSGIILDSICPEDDLDKNWQRLILTHLAERSFPGALIGGELTDVKLTVVGGKAHIKHTEGGDFRQATYRAVRQGLLQAWEKGKCRLLEPIYEFCLEVPTDCIGKVMSDIRMRGGEFGEPEEQSGRMCLRGQVPVSEFVNYQRELLSYTHGEGSMSCIPAGYALCHNTEEVLEDNRYDPENDVNNPGGSIFCSHGAGDYVSWRKVPERAHIPMGEYRKYLSERQDYDESTDLQNVRGSNIQEAEESYEERRITNMELESIFSRTFGSGQSRTRPGYRRSHRNSYRDKITGSGRSGHVYRNGGNHKEAEKKEYLLVDGYNIIHAWEELRSLMERDLGSARGRLMDILSNYQGYKNMILILVFDAYRVPGNPGSIEKYHNIYVVYTKEAETADQYIEKTVHEIGREHHVTVATSDGLEQVIILGNNANRMSAADLYHEIQNTSQEILAVVHEKQESFHHRMNILD